MSSCPKCYGQRRIRLHKLGGGTITTICTYCSGTGQATSPWDVQYSHRPRRHYPEVKLFTCKTCHGSGEIEQCHISGDPQLATRTVCPTCYGYLSRPA